MCNCATSYHSHERYALHVHSKERRGCQQIQKRCWRHETFPTAFISNEAHYELYSENLLGVVGLKKNVQYSGRLNEFSDVPSVLNRICNRDRLKLKAPFNDCSLTFIHLEAPERTLSVITVTPCSAAGKQRLFSFKRKESPLCQIVIWDFIFCSGETESNSIMRAASPRPQETICTEHLITVCPVLSVMLDMLWLTHMAW